MLSVIYSSEQAAEIHAAHEKYGVLMSVWEARVRREAEERGLSYILRAPEECAALRAEVADQSHQEPPDC